jgi:type IV pilus assembly protein PilY1
MTTHRSQHARQRVVSLVLMSMVFQGHVHAADIASVPLATQSTTTVRANMMFIMDDSLSMSWGYLPDNANYGNLCYGYHVTNSIFFNPDPLVTYLPPLRADGTPFPDASFTAAKMDGFDPNSAVVNLSAVANLSTPSTRVGTNSNGSAMNSRFYYATYTANVPTAPACSAGSGNNGYDWTKWTVVTTLPAALQTKYANWYSYYRTRMLTMRTAVGRAMNSIDASRFRIGYSAISSNSYVSSTGFLPVSEFDLGTQKADFYAKLYAAPGAGYTPLRPALEKIGKYYAGRRMNGTALPSAAVDPMQYSCQRNFAMLTTDGYWNRADEPSSTYEPTRIEKTSQGGSIPIGNPDAAAGVTRPKLDDGRTLSNGSWATGGPGVANTLADIAMYFFETDLRNDAVPGTSCTVATGQDVCENIVKDENLPFGGTEAASHQRMTTYALGLGVAGTLTYHANYDTQSASFVALKNGSLAWPNPDPSNTGTSVVTRADDLWHAAVNGRGRYYSASNPIDLATGLSSALDAIATDTGTGAAGATSSQIPVTGDNYAFVAEYTTGWWQGNVKALTIDTGSGAFSTTPLWEAKNTLLAQVQPASDTRTIWFRNPAVASNRLSAFTYTNLDAVGLGTSFVNVCAANNYKLSQCAALVTQDVAANNTTLQTAVNSGDNLVNYLRGRSGLEDKAPNPIANRVFRPRPNTPLGDIVGAAPVYVKKPPFNYVDAGYNTFAASEANRTAVVYVAANDGMLHAFNAATGVELWAYVPRMVMPNLYRLADANFDVNHRFYVDGTPVVGDVFDGTNWRTILVGGLGAGGRGYYALDITDPASPKSLWEFSEADDSGLGLTFGNPVITKNKGNTWVVAFTSGYNNVSPGDGNGHLFVRNAITGAAIDKISTFTAPNTPAGDPASPSDLGRINAWLDIENNNTAKRIYGGDMKGNLWRFDFDDNLAPSGKEATLLGRALTPGGVAQPITTVPILSKIGNSGALPIVAIATGRYLGTLDIADTTLQSIYVFKDDLSASGLGTLRSNSGMVQQTMSSVPINANTTTRRVTNPAPVDWSTNSGWYIDLSLSAGERVNVDMVQTSRLLAVASNIPAPTACTAGGRSWLYNFDIQGGGNNSADGVITDATEYKLAMTAGLYIIKTGDTVRIIVSDVKGRSITTTPKMPGGGANAPRRTSWRELVF